MEWGSYKYLAQIRDRLHLPSTRHQHQQTPAHTSFQVEDNKHPHHETLNMLYVTVVKGVKSYGVLELLRLWQPSPQSFHGFWLLHNILCVHLHYNLTCILKYTTHSIIFYPILAHSPMSASTISTGGMNVYQIFFLQTATTLLHCAVVPLKLRFIE
jgi:hypothetical protein